MSRFHREPARRRLCEVGAAARIVYLWITTGWAATARLMLLVIILPGRISSSARFDSQVAAGFEAIDNCTASELRDE